MTSPVRPASTPNREQIIGLVGDVDDATVMAIVRTGASYVEVEEAARWAAGEAAAQTEPPPLSGSARRVYEVLLTLPSFASPEDRRR